MIQITHITGNRYVLRHNKVEKDLVIIKGNIRANLTSYELKQVKEHFKNIL